MLIYEIIITETLQKSVEVEAGSDDEAIAEVQRLYDDSEIILDYSDLVDTRISNSYFTDKEEMILNEICYKCEECGSKEDCPEEECVLWRIEQIIYDNYFKRKA